MSQIFQNNRIPGITGV